MSVATVEKQEIIYGEPISRFAALFPMMSGRDRELIKSSIASDGQLVAIHRCKASGDILDGRNRLSVLEELGLDPWIEDVITEDPMGWVLANNLERRHMTESERAMLGVRLSKMTGLSRSEAARMTSVSRRLISFAGNVDSCGTELLNDAVNTGGMSVSLASDVSTLPKAEQDRVVEATEVEKKKQSEVSPGATRRTRDQTDVAKKAVSTASEAQFDIKVWRSKAEIAHSKLFAKVPADLQSGARSYYAQHIACASIRLDTDRTSDGTESNVAGFEMMDGDELISYIERSLKMLPKENRDEVSQMISDKYSAMPVTCDALVKVVDESLDAMPSRESKAAMLAIGEKYALPVKISSKPTEYLPGLPDDHVKASMLVKTEFQARIVQLTRFEDWEVNGRRDGCRALRKSVSAALRKLKHHTGSEVPDGEVQETAVLPEHLDTSEFNVLWKSWVDGRKSRRQPRGAVIETRQLITLSRFDLDQAMEILGKAVEKPWQGIPTFGHLAETKWCGRPPARPPEGAKLPKPKGAANTFDPSSKNEDKGFWS